MLDGAFGLTNSAMPAFEPLQNQINFPRVSFDPQSPKKVMALERIRTFRKVHEPGQQPIPLC
jgi:hypothetical protein